MERNYDCNSKKQASAIQGNFLHDKRLDYVCELRCTVSKLHSALRFTGYRVYIYYERADRQIHRAEVYRPHCNMKTISISGVSTGIPSDLPNCNALLDHHRSDVSHLRSDHQRS